jgi:hypothetical protein
VNPPPITTKSATRGKIESRLPDLNEMFHGGVPHEWWHF